MAYSRESILKGALLATCLLSSSAARAAGYGIPAVPCPMPNDYNHAAVLLSESNKAYAHGLYLPAYDAAIRGVALIGYRYYPPNGGVIDDSGTALVFAKWEFQNRRFRPAAHLAGSALESRLDVYRWWRCRSK